MLSLRFPAGMPDGLIARLAAENVYVSPRLGRMRISPHVYNDEADIDRFVTAFRRAGVAPRNLVHPARREGESAAAQT